MKTQKAWVVRTNHPMEMDFLVTEKDDIKHYRNEPQFTIYPVYVTIIRDNKDNPLFSKYDN